MDPVGSNVHGVAVGEAVLVNAATDPVTAFEDCDFEAMLEEDIGAAKTCQTGTYYPDVGGLAISLMYGLVFISIFSTVLFFNFFLRTCWSRSYCINPTTALCYALKDISGMENAFVSTHL